MFKIPLIRIRIFGKVNYSRYIVMWRLGDRVRDARYVGEEETMANCMPAPHASSMALNSSGWTLHRRLSAFVDWIATEASREDEIREQAANIRNAIRVQAAEDGLVIRSTPNSGSFATRTGLRRHMRGLSEVEGQDVDVPFVVAPKTKDDERLDVLLPRFEKYARSAYPDTEREVCKSSVKLKFTSNLNYDLVPLLATRDPERQILVRADGERRETSVQKHIDFVKARTKKSDAVAGRVKFNEVIRLLKWWRCFRQTQDGAVVTDVPSFLMNLLAAHAFDARGVRETYGETVADWFGYLARTVRKRATVHFTDYVPVPNPKTGTIWAVFDPVNNENNVVSSWSGIMCHEFAEWFEEARDTMYEAMAAFDDGRESDGIESLVKVFGTPIRQHSEPER